MVRPRGLKGEFFLDADITRDLPKGTALRVTPPGRTYALRGLNHQNNRALLFLEGVDSVESAETLRGAKVEVARSSMGTDLLLSDLVGCLVLDADSGREIGTVTDWHENPGHPLLELQTGLLIPFVPAFFPTVDVPAKRLLARLPAGLEEL